MSLLDTTIQDLTTRIRSLILKYKEEKEKNAKLQTVVDEKDKEIASLQQELQQEKQRYNNLMTAKMLDITDGNIEETKKKINGLIRTVDKCITLLNEQNI